MEGKNFGQQYLMHRMACNSGLLESLMGVYGEARGRGLAAVAVTHASDIVQHRYILEEVRRSASRELCGAPMDLGWSPSNGINEAAVRAEMMARQLFSRLDGGKAAIVMELTSLREDLNHLSAVNGFRRRSVPGRILYLGVNGTMGIPFYYRFGESSEDGFRAISEVYAEIRAMGPRPIHFVLGRGRSKAEMTYLVDRGVTFTVMVDDYPEPPQSGVESWDGCPSMVMDGSLFRFREHTVALGEGTTRVVEVLNEGIRNDQTAFFLRRLEEVSAFASRTRWGSGIWNKIRKAGYGDVSDCVTLSRGNNGFTVCTPDPWKVESKMRSFGTVTIVTTSDLSPDDLCITLIRRGRFEWELEEFRRNQLNAPEYMSTEQTTRGMFLLDFLRMVLKSQLNLELYLSGSYLSPDDALDTLKGLRVNHIGKEWVLDDLNNDQIRLLRSLGIRIPDDRVATMVMGGDIPRYIQAGG